MDAKESSHLKKLRQRAEELNEEIHKVGSDKNLDVYKLLHEIRTYEIELELQNDDLRQSEQTLSAISTKYQRLYDDAPVGYFLMNTKNVLVETNRTLDLMLDQPPPKSVPFSLLFHSDDQNELYGYLQKIRLEERFSFNIRLKTAELNWVRVDIINDTVDDTTNDRTVSLSSSQFRGTITDISELKLSEENRLATEESMHRAQKLESLGVLAGGIAHDFNNLLMIISGNLDLLRNRVTQDARSSRNMAAIETASNRAAELCKQMLTYAGHGTVKTMAIDLNHSVRDMMRLIESSIPSAAVQEVELASNLPLIEGDLAQVTQVIMNLVINASDALGDEGGLIHIETMRTSSNPPLVCLEVSDTGCGMDEKTRERIFDPFFTTKFPGRGLGMAAVLGIVNSLNATIQVKSTPGKGSTIRVFFNTSSSSRLNESPKETLHKIDRQGIILVVDDEESLRTLYTAMLQEVGYTVIVASNGLEAVQVFLERRHEIDAIFMDLTMPMMNGKKALELIRDKDKEIPVLLASGYTEDSIPLLKSSRRTSFITKPCSSVELIHTLDSLITEQNK